MTKTGDAANESKIARKRREEKLDRAQEIKDLRDICGLPAGRRFLMRILEHCHIYSTSMSDDPHLTSFREGERNVGLWMAAEIGDAAPQEWLMMQQERLNEIEKERRKEINDDDRDNRDD